MKNSTNIQIINNIHKVLSRSLSHLFIKNKNYSKTKRTIQNIRYGNNNKLYKNNILISKSNFNENNENLLIKVVIIIFIQIIIIILIKKIY